MMRTNPVWKRLTAMAQRASPIAPSLPPQRTLPSPGRLQTLAGKSLIFFSGISMGRPLTSSGESKNGGNVALGLTAKSSAVSAILTSALSVLRPKTPARPCKAGKRFSGLGFGGQARLSVFRSMDFQAWRIPLQGLLLAPESTGRTRRADQSASGRTRGQ